MHRSRLCHFVIDVGDLDQAVAFWSLALDAPEEPVVEGSEHVYRRLRLPDSEVRVLLLGGVPLNEPVARRGPFVMNTNEEINQAIVDYQAGRMGAIDHTTGNEK